MKKENTRAQTNRIFKNQDPCAPFLLSQFKHYFKAGLWRKTYNDMHILYLLCSSTLSAGCPKSRQRSPATSIWLPCTHRTPCCWRTTRCYCPGRLFSAPTGASAKVVFHHREIHVYRENGRRSCGRPTSVCSKFKFSSIYDKYKLFFFSLITSV